jgi:hypothetical protein
LRQQFKIIFQDSPSATIVSYYDVAGRCHQLTALSAKGRVFISIRSQQLTLAMRRMWLLIMACARVCARASQKHVVSDT